MIVTWVSTSQYRRLAVKIPIFGWSRLVFRAHSTPIEALACMPTLGRALQDDVIIKLQPANELS